MVNPKDTTESLERGLTLYKCQGGPYELQNALTGELTEKYECYLKGDVDKVVRGLTDKVNQYKTLFNEKCRDINTQEKLFAEQIAQLRNENKELKESLERQQNAYLTLDEAYQRDTGIVCKAVNPGVPCAEMKKVMEENELLKDELLDAKRDACRFEKAMYRASFNWVHARSFIYMKEHYASIDSEIPPQWRRALDLCMLGYEFAKIVQDKLPKKPKTPEEDNA